MAKNTMLLLHSQDVCLTMLNCPLLLIQPHRPSCEVRHTDRPETYAVRSRLQGYADILFARTQHCSSAWGEGKLGRSGGGGAKGELGSFCPSVPHMLEQVCTCTIRHYIQLLKSQSQHYCDKYVHFVG